MGAETLAALVTDRAGTYIDGTVGDGGHARLILEATAPAGRLIGFDRDATALATARVRLAPYGERVTLIQDDFAHLAVHWEARGREPFAGVLLDLGLRSSALDDAGRGFSYRAAGPLDMRFDPRRGETAAEFLARVSESELIALLETGTTRASPRRIARGILAWRRSHSLQSTHDLVACLRATCGRRADAKLLGSVFATLRMAVNDELGALDRALAAIPALLRRGGVLCVIAYQSQEDRRVKLLARAELTDPTTGEAIDLEPLWRRPLRPDPQECRRNPRARSARLRALRRRPNLPLS